MTSYDICFLTLLDRIMRNLSIQMKLPIKRKHSPDLSLTSYQLRDSIDTYDKSCEGHLYIQSKTLWKFPPYLWKRRYFVLQRDVLYFFKTRESMCEDTDLDEQSSNLLKIQSDTGIYPEESCSKGFKKYLIRITHGKLNYVLCTSSEQDRNTWLASLLTVITRKFIGSLAKKPNNTKPVPKQKSKSLSARYSSFFPAPEDADCADDDAVFLLKTSTGPVYKAESMFDLSSDRRGNLYYSRSSFVALA